MPLPAKLTNRAETIAKQHALSNNRVMVGLIKQGNRSAKAEGERFFQLVDRFKQSGDGLGRLVFGSNAEYRDKLRLPRRQFEIIISNAYTIETLASKT